MTPTQFLDSLTDLFHTRGHTLYGGEAVSQLEHALQAAALAHNAGSAPAEVAAALLHDIGHLLHGKGDDCADHGIDDQHEALGVRFLARFFPPAVTEPIRLHVAAKRYLCTAEPGYFETLSAPSVTSLRLQGGPMTPTEMAAFEANPHFAAAIALRKRDDAAKVVGCPTPSLADFRPHLESCLVCIS
ncbi:MAG: metal-dependent phosphohydrolase [Fimbriiglobus sp.]|jgi:phosphonate degradation associated HDIG domain protein|nr:metal-dependent phosphohydrolase [Fimbriiglobus sp.]